MVRIVVTPDFSGILLGVWTWIPVTEIYSSATNPTIVVSLPPQLATSPDLEEFNCFKGCGL